LERAFFIAMCDLGQQEVESMDIYRHGLRPLLVVGFFFLALPSVAQVWTTCSNSESNICFLSGNVGIGTGFPGERLHVADANILLEGGGETAIKVKRDIVLTGGVSGTSPNPIFELGRIIQAGDGDPEFRFLYSDDNSPVGRSVFEFDRKGIVASVRQDRGSHFEGFLTNTDPQPAFRLNSFPRMRLEMGAGGTAPVDVAIERAAPGTLAFIANDEERLRVSADSISATGAYIQLEAFAGMPPGADCANPEHIGRMKVDLQRPRMYVCTANGWGAITLNRSGKGESN
jgi:hypothetical protein